MPPLAIPARDADPVLAVFARAGRTVSAANLDTVLAAIADGGMTLFSHAVEEDDGIPVALMSDLLTVVSALRVMLGMAPTPVNAEIFAQLPGGARWSREQAPAAGRKRWFRRR